MCDKNNNKIPCGCEEVEFCGCTTKLDLLCTYYEGETLDTLGIKKGMSGKEIVVVINNYLETILQNLDISPTIIDNVGGGVVVYKGLSSEFIEEFKSLSGVDGIKIEPGENLVTFSIDEEWLETKILESIEAHTINTSLDFRFSSEPTPGTPDTQPAFWKPDATPIDKWMAIKETIDSEQGDWKVIKIQGNDGIDGEDGTPGVTSRNVVVFRRSETQPSTPTGGTFSNPAPIGWSQGIPPISAVSVGPVWQSNRIFTSTGVFPQEANWSVPTKVVDNETIDYEFSGFTGTAPGTPSFPLNGATWHNEGVEDDIWMAFRTLSNGVGGVWSVVRIKGETGPAGANGTGLSVISNNPVQSLAVGSDGIASIATEYLVSLSVFNNATPLSPMAEPLIDGGFTIVTPASPLTGITVTKINGNTLKYSVAPGTNFGDVSVTSTIDIKIGAANTIVKTTFVIIPIMTAEDSQSLTITTDSNIVKFDNFGNIDTPTSITVRGLQQNYSETITWSSVPAGIVTGTGNIKVIDTSTLFSGSTKSVKIRIDTPNGLFDETTIFKIQDGAGGAPGINGTSGPTPRLLEFVMGGEYENGEDFIDYAYYRTSDINEGWYTVKVVGGVRTVVTYPGGAPDLTKFDKAPFTKEMSFGTVIAEQANLAGFIFRNQKLNSQAKGTMSCAGVPTEHSNLELDGRQGIIKFLDRMVLNESGLTLKDNCGKPRIKMQWDVSGIPILQFLDEYGVVTWEAGDGGYKTFIIAKDNAFYSYRAILDSSVGLGAVPTTIPVSQYKDRFCLCSETTEYGQFMGIKNAIQIEGTIIGYQIFRGTDILPSSSPNPIPVGDDKKVVTVLNDHTSPPPADGWYITDMSNTGADIIIAEYVKLVSGKITASKTVSITVPTGGAGALYPCGTHAFDEC